MKNKSETGSGDMMRNKRLRDYVERYQDDLKFFQDVFLRERILGLRELQEEKILKRMAHLDIRLSGPYYCVTIFAPYLMDKEAETIDSLLMKMHHQIEQSYRGANFECYSVSDSYCNVIAILSLETKEEYDGIVKLTGTLTKKMISSYKIDMFTGIGSLVERISELSNSKETAAQALAYKFSFSQNHVIHAKDVDRYFEQGTRDLRRHYDWILGCFYDGDMDLMTIRFRNLRTDIRLSSKNELESMRNICIELTAALQRRVHEMGISASPEMDGIYTYIAKISSTDEIENWFLTYCAGLLQKVSELRQSKNRQIIRLAEEYIQKNIGDKNLSIQRISDAVDLSPSYFSGIFYNEIGIHLNEYVNQMRINQAKEMLATTNEKIVSIAEKVGFSSSNYFNNVFKRYTGVTPQRYRNNLN